MKPNFAGAKLKVQRAQKHIGELETWLRRAAKANVDSLLTQRYSRGPDDIGEPLQLRSTNPGPIVGDIVHNLRSALDHCAYALCKGAVRKRDMIYFPLDKTRKSLVTQPRFRAIERAYPIHANVIANVIKPYKTANYAFWALNQLDRMDKHRSIVSTEVRTTFPIELITEEQEGNPPAVRLGSIFKVVRARPDGSILVGNATTRPPRPGTKVVSLVVV